MTMPTLMVISALLAEPGREMYGMEIMRATGLMSGTIFPIFRRLEDNGWVTSRWEVLDPVRAGRRPRHYYQLTPAGISQGSAMLTTAQEKFAGIRWP